MKHSDPRVDAVREQIAEYVHTAIEATRLGIQADTDTVTAVITGNIMATIETHYASIFLAAPE